VLADRLALVPFAEVARWVLEQRLDQALRANKNVPNIMVDDGQTALLFFLKAGRVDGLDRRQQARVPTAQ
jgi:hypothetical protein